MKTTLIPLFLTCLFVTACASAPFSLSPAATPVQAQLDQPFTLDFGRSVQLAGDDLTVTFVEMRQDSRCPSEVNCAERGQAIISIQAQKGSLPPSTFDLTY